MCLPVRLPSPDRGPRSRLPDPGRRDRRGPARRIPVLRWPQKSASVVRLGWIEVRSRSSSTSTAGSASRPRAEGQALPLALTWPGRARQPVSSSLEAGTGPRQQPGPGRGRDSSSSGGTGPGELQVVPVVAWKMCGSCPVAAADDRADFVRRCSWPGSWRPAWPCPRSGRRTSAVPGHGGLPGPGRADPQRDPPPVKVQVEAVERRRLPRRILDLAPRSRGPGPSGQRPRISWCWDRFGCVRGLGQPGRAALPRLARARWPAAGSAVTASKASRAVRTRTTSGTRPSAPPRPSTPPGRGRPTRSGRMP